MTVNPRYRVDPKTGKAERLGAGSGRGRIRLTHAPLIDVTATDELDAVLLVQRYQRGEIGEGVDVGFL